MKKFYPLFFYVSLILVWQLVSLSGLVSEDLFPSPSSVLMEFFRMLSDGTLIEAFWYSLFRAFVGYALAAVVGVLFGIAISRFEWTESTIGSLVQALQSLPAICLLPLAILWFGLSEWAILFVVFIGAVFSIILGTQSGIRHVPLVLIRAAESMGAHGFDLYRRVILPAAFPAVIMGLKQGWAFGWRALMAGELLYGTTGLGHLLKAGKETGITQFMVLILIILFLGILVEKTFFAPLEKKVHERWGLLR